MLYGDSYFVTSQVLRFGHLSKAETLLDTVLRFFATVDKEVMRVTFCFISNTQLQGGRRNLGPNLQNILRFIVSLS